VVDPFLLTTEGPGNEQVQCVAERPIRKRRGHL